MHEISKIMLKTIKRLLRGKRYIKDLSPTGILVEMICLKILAEPKTTREMSVSDYYESFTWAYPEKSIFLHFNTESYSPYALPYTIDSLTIKSTTHELTRCQESRLIKALTEGHLIATKKIETQAKLDRELKACDSIEHLLGVNQDD